MPAGLPRCGGRAARCRPCTPRPSPHASSCARGPGLSPRPGCARRRSRASRRRDRGRSLRCAGLAQGPGRRAQAVMETGEGSGLPAKCAFRLARINAVAAVRDSGARPATCGVTTTLSHCSSSGRSGGTLGSPSRTSRPAPATRFDRSASISAWVSTTVPRPTLTR